MIELLNTDCVTYMKTLKDKEFDLAIVDPEYGINASKGTWGSSNLGKVTDYGKKDWDKKPVSKEVPIVNNFIWWCRNFIVSLSYNCKKQMI